MSRAPEMPPARRLALVGTWMFVGGLAALPISAGLLDVVGLYNGIWISFLALATTLAGGFLGLAGVLADRPRKTDERRRGDRDR